MFTNYNRVCFRCSSIYFIYYIDLKAFERRLTEVVSSYRPSTFRWRSKLNPANEKREQYGP